MSGIVRIGGSAMADRPVESLGNTPFADELLEQGLTASYGKIVGKVDVVVAQGDLTKIRNVCAWIVPQFTNCSNTMGVGGAIIRAGGRKGLDAYQEFLNEGNHVNYGDALLSDAGEAPVKKLIHAVTVISSGEINQYKVVSEAAKNCLKGADAEKCESIVFPALGSGIIGNLTVGESAEAILSEVKNQSRTVCSVTKIALVVFGDVAGYQESIRLLKNIEELSIKPESKSGSKEIDPARALVHLMEEIKYS